jgi:transcription initiation factor TFIIIB Brf1 subunit/transcription initiation factor TFIIB
MSAVWSTKADSDSLLRSKQTLFNLTSAGAHRPPTMPKSSYNLVAERSLRKLDELADTLDLSEEAATCCKETALESEISNHGFLMETVIGGIAYTCSRKHSEYRPARRIADTVYDRQMKTTPQSIQAGIIEVHKRLVDDMGYSLPPPRPVDLLPAVADELSVPDPVYGQAKTFCEAMNERPVFTGKNPSGLAAGAIHAAARMYDGAACVSVEELLDASGCCKTTVIRSRQLVEDELAGCG